MADSAVGGTTAAVRRVAGPEVSAVTGGTTAGTAGATIAGRTGSR
ncbi:hypothetical protein [Streptomyces ovatisporus]